MADIRLTDRNVVLEGHRVVCTAVDLVLDHPDRRSEDAGGLRRALVHDFADGLTLNWAGDYPGGVTILGPVRIPDVHAGNLTVRLKHPRPSVGPLWVADPITGGVRRNDDLARTDWDVDVAEELERLQGEIQRLKDRVSELEGAGG